MFLLKNSVCYVVIIDHAFCQSLNKKTIPDFHNNAFVDHIYFCFHN